MVIAYVTRYDARDITSWSGLNFYLSRVLELNGISVEYIGNLRIPDYLTEKIKERAIPLLTGKRYRIDRSIPVARSYARQVAKKLRKIKADVVFCPANLPIAFLETDIPIVFYTDACFANMIDYYPDFANLCEETIRSGHIIEKESLERCIAVGYSSRWAADSVIANYGVPPEKVHVIPFGANMEVNHMEEELMRWVRTRDKSICRLLFIGVEWYRKGGAKALKVTEELLRLGIPAELSVVGCPWPEGLPVPEFVKYYVFINKHDPQGIWKLYELYKHAHFFLLPTMAEAFGLVFAEAAAFGLPSISHATGGLPEVIRNDRNGRLFSLESSAEEMAAYIAELWNDRMKYEELCQRSFREYRERLNWEVNGKALIEVIRNAVKT